ncbi:MAG: hypothetical protein RIF33_21770 [Cyclobacteriaceae bacterium]
MNKLLKILTLFPILLISSVEAQISTSEQEVKSIDVWEQVLNNQNEEVFPPQIDSKSLPVYSVPQYPNLTQLIQQGQLNEIRATQQGVANTILVNQFGIGNQSDISEKGDFISATILQLGHDNTVFQELGDSYNTYHILQRGYDHEVIDRGFNTDNPGYTIRQEGLVGMKVIIRHR